MLGNKHRLSGRGHDFQSSIVEISNRHNVSTKFVAGQLYYLIEILTASKYAF